MEVLLGLAAAMCWGLGDFAITKLARYVGTARSLLYIQVFSLLSWIVLLQIFPHTIQGGGNAWMIAALAGLFHVGGLVLTYRAFEIGTLSLVSPIASSFAVVTALLVVASGSTPPPIDLAGTVLLVVGVVVVSRTAGDSNPTTLKGVPQAIGSALAFGVMFWIINAYVSQPLGHVYPLIVLKVMATSYAVIMVALVKRKGPEEAVEKAPPLKLGMIALVAALFDSLAWGSWLYGNSRGANLAVITALASLFSAVTVVMAWIFLKERLKPAQWVGVVVIIFGILLVSLPK